MFCFRGINSRIEIWPFGVLLIRLKLVLIVSRTCFSSSITRIYSSIFPRYCYGRRNLPWLNYGNLDIFTGRTFGRFVFFSLPLTLLFPILRPPTPDYRPPITNLRLPIGSADVAYSFRVAFTLLTFSDEKVTKNLDFHKAASVALISGIVAKKME